METNRTTVPLLIEFPPVDEDALNGVPMFTFGNGF